MSSKRRKKPDPPLWVRVEDCHERHEKIELALFGKDGRHGMAAQVNNIENKLAAYTGIVRTVLVPIGVSVLTALIVAGILGKL
jgi:hypothetical protein